MTKKSPTGRTLSLPEPQRIQASAKQAKEVPPTIVNMDFSSIEQRAVEHLLDQQETKNVARGTDTIKKMYGVGFKHRERRINGARPITFEEACRKYVHRFTMDHVPAWAGKVVARTGKYPGPHYGSDLEWYKNTEFPGEGTTTMRGYCRSLRQTWPLGKQLDKPYTLGKVSKEAAGVAAPIMGADGQLHLPPKAPDPRAVKRAERRRQGRLAQFEITPIEMAIRDHKPEPKVKKVVPTVEQLVRTAPKGKKPATKGKTKKQRKATESKKR